MGFRFRRSLKLFPGLKINFSKSGPSLSVGGRGHTLNVSIRGARATVGIPGTGLSYSKRLSAPPKTTSTPAPYQETSKSMGHVLLKVFLFLAVLGIGYYILH